MNIGDVFFALRGDGGPLQVDAKKAAEAAGTAGANSFGARFKAAVMGPAFSTGLGAGVGVAAFGLLSSAVGNVTDVLGDAVRAAMEEERAVKTLDAAIRASIPTWDGRRDAIDTALKKGMDLAFSDDVLRDSLQKLIPATKNVNKAIDLQSIAMDLARLRGMSLEEATTLVIKANAGQIGAVRRLLPWLDKNASAAETLAAIEKAAAGAKETYAATAEGSLARAQIQMNEAMERLGEVMVPVVTGLASITADVLPVLTKALDDAAKATGNLVDELIGGLGDLTGREDPIEDIRKALDFLGYSAEIVADNVVNGSNKMIDAEGYIADVAADAATAADAMVAKVVALGPALHRGVKPVETASGEIGDAVVTAMERGRLGAVQIAAKTPQDIADALRTGRTSIDDAIALLREDMTRVMAPADEVKRRTEQLVDKGLLAGLRSKDPAIKAQAQATTQLLVNQLIMLEGQAFDYGKKTGNSYADGIVASEAEIRRASQTAVRAASGAFKASSPPGPESPLHLIDVWGERTGEAWAAGLARGVAAGRRTVLGSLGGSFTAAAPTYASAFASASPFGGAGIAVDRSPIHTHVYLNGREIATAVDEEFASMRRP